MEDKETQQQKKIDMLLYRDAEMFHARINVDPPKQEIQVNTYANNSKYLPISFIQMKLDEFYFGLWRTENFKTKVVANEITGEVELSVFHPVYQQWITRVGAASVMIQLRAQYEYHPNGEIKTDRNGAQIKKKKNILDAAEKIENTLVKDYPHLYAECVKSAAKTLGKVFGRDLNRKFIDSYTPFSLQLDTTTIRKRIGYILNDEKNQALIPANHYQLIKETIDSMTDVECMKAMEYLQTILPDLSKFITDSQNNLKPGQENGNTTIE